MYKQRILKCGCVVDSAGNGAWLYSKLCEDHRIHHSDLSSIIVEDGSIIQIISHPSYFRQPGKAHPSGKGLIIPEDCFAD